MKTRRRPCYVCAIAALCCAALAQPPTTREHPDYARVPQDVAQELNLPAQPKDGQVAYGFGWGRIEGYAPDRWVTVGGRYTRRLRVDGNKNGKLEDDDPIREETFVHYYVASTSVTMGGIADWQPPRDPAVVGSRPLGEREKAVALGDFAYVRFGPGDLQARCRAESGPLWAEATVEYRPVVAALSGGLRGELHAAGINLYEYIDEPAWNTARDKATGRCPELAVDVVRQMLARWQAYARDKLLPGNGFKGLFVTTEPYQLTAEDLPPQLTMGSGPQFTSPTVLWRDATDSTRILEQYGISLQRWAPESFNPLGWALQEARKGFADQCTMKHPYPVDLPGSDQVARGLYRDLGDNHDAIDFRYGNVVGKVWTQPRPRSVVAPGHWTVRLAQALCLRLQSRAVPRELWDEKPVEPALLAPYRMVCASKLPVQVEEIRYDYKTGQVKSTQRAEQQVDLGWIAVAEGPLPLPSRHVQKAEWLGRDFTCTYRWTNQGQEVSGTVKAILSADLQRLDRLVMHQVRLVRSEFDPGVWEVDKTEQHLELQGTQLLGLGSDQMDCFPLKITTYACTHSWDLQPLNRIKLRVIDRTKSVSERPGKDAGGVPITFYR